MTNTVGKWLVQRKSNQVPQEEKKEGLRTEILADRAGDLQTPKRRCCERQCTKGRNKGSNPSGALQQSQLKTCIG